MPTDSADRHVAEWTLTMGGRVGLAGQTRRISDIADLPAGDIQLEVLDWLGMNVDPPDLERLSGLTHLKELHLPGPIWNRNVDGGRDGSKDLRFLASVHTLESLTFGYHFLDRIRFRDTGLVEIKGLTNLRELAVRQSNITGEALAPFKQMRALDAGITRFNDMGMRNLEGMQNLRRLWVGDTNITDAGLASVGNLTNLEDLDLHGTAITDAGLTNLAKLTGLTKLNLMGTGVTDAAIDIVLGMPRLEEVNLYRTKISNTGLARLKTLSSLAEIDLRYSRATSGGVQTLRAALPSADVLYLELSSRPQPAKNVAQLSGVAWVRAMGGKTPSAGVIALSGATVTDSQLEKLAGLPHTRSLNLEG